MRNPTSISRFCFRFFSQCLLLSAVAGAVDPHVLALPMIPQDTPPVEEIEIRVTPETARVRPLQTAVIQVLAYGDVTEAGEETKRVRVAADDARFSLSGSKSGWLSKPYRFQGDEDEDFYTPEGGGFTDILLGQALGALVIKDAVLYTAPHSPGRYKIRVELDGQSKEVTLVVDRKAPVTVKKETTSFPVQSARESRYRHLAEHHAPFVAQATWFDPKADYIARFDFDGDWRGDNNWDSSPVGSSQAYVYYAAMETATHWFLVYDIFHPRDYSDKCLAGTCHENDSEGLVLTILKDGSDFGRLQTMETLAHDNIYSYRADKTVKKNIHNIDGDVEFFEGHPIVFIESGGHGVYGSDDRRSLYKARDDSFRVGTGVTYAYRGRAERPEHPDDRLVGYELLPAYEHWWVRGHQQRSAYGVLFDDYRQYSPYGRRPAGSQNPIAGAFRGRKFGKNKAKPFWAWSDRRTNKKKALSPGQWTIDPAYAVTRNLRFRERVSLDYLYNPYLRGNASSNRIPIAPPPDRGASLRLPVAPRPAPAPPPRPPSGVGGSFTATRASSYDSGSRKGQFDLKVLVDGDVELLVRGDRVVFRVLSGSNPSNVGSEFSQPLPNRPFSKFELDKKDGRSRVRLIERPAADNGYTARIRISDSKSGSDRYHVRLKWKIK